LPNGAIDVPTRTQLSNLSVVIPVWGSYFTWLPELIAALSDVPDDQIIIVTNGQPLDQPLDQPLELDRGRWLMAAEPLSVGACRNLGLAMVTTALVAFIDADDLPLPGALAQLTALIDQAQDHRVIGATGLVVRANGQLYPWPRLPRPGTPHWWQATKQWSFNRWSMTTGTVLVTTAVHAVGGFPDASLAEDGMLASLLIGRGTMLWHRGPTRIYRQHADGLCQRGRSAREWRAAYHQQRMLLAASSVVPIWGRIIQPLLAPLHWRNASRLAKTVRYDK
jgi:glycosyltransferase involved in cell wall biosynthesis